MSEVSALQKLYRMDEIAWRERNVRLLEEGRLSEIDAVNIAVCLAEMGNSEQRAFESFVTLVLRHLLLIRFSGDSTPVNHWKAEVRSFQRNLRKQFISKNWLNRYSQFVEECYKDALEDAQDEYPGASFPEENPFTIIEVYGRDPTL